MNAKQFAQNHRNEYIEFCQTIVNEYNCNHMDNITLSDVIDTTYTYQLFYVNFLVLA